MASTTTAARQNVSGMPDIKVSARQVFGIDADMEVPAFSAVSEHVPVVDDAYLFDHDTTMAILAGFAFNRRVMVQGYHGTGKSTHIEQISRNSRCCTAGMRVASALIAGNEKRQK